MEIVKATTDGTAMDGEEMDGITTDRKTTDGGKLSNLCGVDGVSVWGKLTNVLPASNADPAASVAEETHQTSTQDEEQPSQGGWGVELRAEVAETSKYVNQKNSVVSSSQFSSRS